MGGAERVDASLTCVVVTLRLVALTPLRCSRNCMGQPHRVRRSSRSGMLSCTGWRIVWPL